MAHKTAFLALIALLVGFATACKRRTETRVLATAGSESPGVNLTFVEACSSQAAFDGQNNRSTSASTALSLTGDGGDQASHAGALVDSHCAYCHGPDGAGYPKDSIEYKGWARLPDILAYSNINNLKNMIENDQMPPRQKDSDSVLPRKDKDAIIAFLEKPRPSADGMNSAYGFISPATVNDCISKDASAPGNAGKNSFFLYFSFAHLMNPLRGPSRGLSASELKTHTDALNHLINSLSSKRDLIKAEPIDPLNSILRIDYRDVGWDRTDVAVLQGAYKRFRLPDDQHIRGDWFIGAASQGRLYYDLLPVSLKVGIDSLENDLGVDVMESYDSGTAVRFGFSTSSVSSNYRVIERHETKFGGYYWKSFDFASKIDGGDLLTRPYGPVGTRFTYQGELLDIPDERKFEHDGGEFIFSLPNGMQGYVLADDKGHLLFSQSKNLYGDEDSSGPTKIVTDYFRSALSHGAKNEVVNAYSCMGCHYKGMKWEGSVIFPTDRYLGSLKDSVGDNEKSFLSALYNDNKDKNVVSKTLAKDERRYLEAYKGITDGLPSSSPVFHVAFAQELPMTFDQVAAELGVTRRRLALWAKDQESEDKLRTTKAALWALVIHRDSDAMITDDHPIEVSYEPSIRREDFYPQFELIVASLHSAREDAKPVTTRPIYERGDGIVTKSSITQNMTLGKGTVSCHFIKSKFDMKVSEINAKKSCRRICTHKNVSFHLVKSGRDLESQIQNTTRFEHCFEVSLEGMTIETDSGITLNLKCNSRGCTSEERIKVLERFLGKYSDD